MRPRLQWRLRRWRSERHVSFFPPVGLFRAATHPIRQSSMELELFDNISVALFVMGPAAPDGENCLLPSDSAGSFHPCPALRQAVTPAAWASHCFPPSRTTFW